MTDENLWQDSLSRIRREFATLPVPEKRSRNAAPLMSPRMLKRA